ncbi:HGxxPAAW family protein [Streptomyces xiaopingdaonensis]|uniref:HGxxPAAW family protein n=1 Tax=Streptomyces xiaopingdaonensis TaxID=1565415 RepID=UPI000311ACB9|nr:HGxxPAAW family protein [Streptomyces xiaopingdaonensis]
MADTGHGNTVAAWTGVTIAFIGFCIGSAFMVMAQPWGVVAGLVVVGAGGLVGMAMSAAGMGKERNRPTAKAATEPGGTAGARS